MAETRSLPPLFPLFLRLEGRRVLVVGGGPVALAKVDRLRESGARVVLVSPDVLSPIEAPDVEIRKRAFRESDLDGVWLVIAAATPEVNREVARAAERRCLFVNAVDDPAAGGACLGAVLRRGGLTLAVSTEGVAPALAGLVREGLEAVLPEEIAEWVECARRERARWKADARPHGERRPLLLAALNRLYAERSEVER